MQITQRKKNTEYEKFHNFLISGGSGPPQSDTPDDENNINKIILSIIAVSGMYFSIKRYFK